MKSLSAREAKFVVIGAMAFPMHGYARATLNIDLLIEPTAANAQKVHRMKAAAGRAKDLEDLKHLRRLKP